MSESLSDRLFATVTITKAINADDDIVLDITAEDWEGYPLALIDALGMLELGKDTLIRKYMAEAEEDKP